MAKNLISNQILGLKSFLSWVLPLLVYYLKENWWTKLKKMVKKLFKNLQSKLKKMIKKTHFGPDLGLLDPIVFF